MLNPNIGELIGEYDNRYELVLDVAKRARKIADINQTDLDPKSERSVTLAIDQLASEKAE
ncbi:MAG: DNA-directed RNA polymerase subunit omega [Oscillospiraceae bacterium]|nr:DNA-directed RNA polymerase subunit omega [Candidatus Equicaccousia limihippi]